MSKSPNASIRLRGTWDGDECFARGCTAKTRFVAHTESANGGDGYRPVRKVDRPLCTQHASAFCHKYGLELPYDPALDIEMRKKGGV